jgi:hypothetical protein
LRAASQSKTEVTDLALNGDLALCGESRCETAGLGGNLKLGKVAGPVGGADRGPGPAADTNGLGGTQAAVAGGDSLPTLVELTLVVLEDGDGRSSLDACDRSLLAVLGTESGESSPDAAAVAAAVIAGLGELRSIALVRKSV